VWSEGGGKEEQEGRVKGNKWERENGEWRMGDGE